MRKDHEILGDLYCEQVLNEGPFRNAAIGAAALATSGFLGGNNAKAEDSAPKSPMVQQAQAASQQHAQTVSQAPSLLKNTQGLNQLATQIKQDRNVVNKPLFIKTLCQLYKINDDSEALNDAILKDVNTFEKTFDNYEKGTDPYFVMDYLSSHGDELRGYIKNVVDGSNWQQKEIDAAYLRPR